VKYRSGYQIKEDEMDEKCSTHGSRVFRLENLKGRDHSEDLDIDARIILDCILEK
jgi:hypothetical protein